MTTQQCKGLRDQTYQIHQAEDQNSCPNYHQSDYRKMTDPEDYPKEDSPEDSREEEDSREGEEDSLEVEDTRAEEEYRLEDHQEVDGDHPHCQCRKPIKGS